MNNNTIKHTHNLMNNNNIKHTHNLMNNNNIKHTHNLMNNNNITQLNKKKVFNKKGGYNPKYTHKRNQYYRKAPG